MENQKLSEFISTIKYYVYPEMERLKKNMDKYMIENENATCYDSGLGAGYWNFCTEHWSSAKWQWKYLPYYIVADLCYSTPLSFRVHIGARSNNGHCLDYYDSEKGWTYEYYKLGDNFEGIINLLIGRFAKNFLDIYKSRYLCNNEYPIEHNVSSYNL